MIYVDDLARIEAAIVTLCDEAEQDRTLVCDMACAMLNDLIHGGALGPLEGYVKTYCDVLDGPDDVGPIVARIVTGPHPAEAPGGPV